MIDLNNADLNEIFGINIEKTDLLEEEILEENVHCDLRSIDAKLVKLKAIESILLAFEVDPHPDYDITAYGSYEQKDYYFKTSIQIPDAYKRIISVRLIDSVVYHYSSGALEDAEYECGIENKNEIKAINRINSMLSMGELEKILAYSEPDLGESFVLNKLDIEGIYQRDYTFDDTTFTEHYISFIGGFRGDNYGISSSEFGVFAIICGLYINKNVNDSSFYVELLAEARTLFEIKEWRMVVFTAFSALESYINYKLYVEDGSSSYNDEKIPLSHKYENLKQICPITNDDELNHVLGNFEDYRNDIAHGRKGKYHTESDAFDILESVCKLILAHEN